MIFGVMLNPDGAEERKIRRIFSELTAYYTDEELEIKTFHKSSLMLMQLEEAELLDVAIIDVTLPGALEGARLIRKRFTKTEILVIADVSISPMEYIHPSIRASSLLLRPMTDSWKVAIQDFFNLLLKKDGEENQSNVLWIENRSGTFRVPFEQIYYLEAREKKVFVRTRMEEFGISGTIEKLADQLPKNFMRCHRSFIVNRDCITQIKLSENLLYLREDLFVPVSRSYKSAFKRQSNE